jgi:hypothetical protein
MSSSSFEKEEIMVNYRCSRAIRALIGVHLPGVPESCLTRIPDQPALQACTGHKCHAG